MLNSPNADLQTHSFLVLSLLEDHGLFSRSDMVLDLFAKGELRSIAKRMIRLRSPVAARCSRHLSHSSLRAQPDAI
jgi:hypothetical protein